MRELLIAGLGLLIVFAFFGVLGWACIRAGKDTESGDL